MSTTTQIRTLQKAWDMMAEKIVTAENSLQTLWISYGHNKDRIVALEERMAKLEEADK